MAATDQTSILDLNEIVSLYANQVASKQLADKINLDNLRLKIDDQKWQEERKECRAPNANATITFTVTKGQMKGLNKELKITLPEGLPVKEFKFNPGQRQTEASITSDQTFSGLITLQVLIRGNVLFHCGSKTHEIEFAQIIADLLKLDKKLPWPLSIRKTNQGLPEYAELTIEGHLKIQ